jgi:hypothetical protein
MAAGVACDFHGIGFVSDAAPENCEPGQVKLGPDGCALAYCPEDGHWIQLDETDEDCGTRADTNVDAGVDGDDAFRPDTEDADATETDTDG